MQYTGDIDSYWTHNLVIGEGDIQGHKSLIRLHLHRSEETFHHAATSTPNPTFSFPG
jgi:hypothetical protein